MIRLAIETSTQVCSAAIQLADGTLLEKTEKGRSIHSEKLFLFLRQLLDENRLSPDDIGEILLSRGPGQYTGLRIGAAAVKGFLFGRSIPLFTLGTLEAFAAGIAGRFLVDGQLYAVLDARRKHLYCQRFRISAGKVLRNEPQILEIHQIEHQLNPEDIVVGTGFERLTGWDEGAFRTFDERYISAESLIIARMDSRFRDRFQQEDPFSFEPEYLSSSQINNSQTR